MRDFLNLAFFSTIIAMIESFSQQRLFLQGFSQPGWNPQLFHSNGINNQFPSSNFGQSNFGFRGQNQANQPQNTFGQSGNFPGFGFGPNFGLNFGQSPFGQRPTGEAATPSPIPVQKEGLNDDEQRLAQEIFTQTPTEVDATTLIPVSSLSPVSTTDADDSPFSEDCEACYDIDRRIQNK